jgi:hypothetical protein
MANLKKYQLTPKGVVSPVINLPKNIKTGDPRMRYVTSSLTDDQAELLLSRKDGKAKQFITAASSAPSTGKSSLSSAKK